MIDKLIEFCFCPVHGLFAPTRWPFLLAAASMGLAWIRRVIACRKGRKLYVASERRSVGASDSSR